MSVNKRMATIPTLETVLSWIPRESLDKLDRAIPDYKSLVQIADKILEWDGPVGDELALDNVDRHDIKTENPFNAQLQRYERSIWTDGLHKSC